MNSIMGETCLVTPVIGPGRLKIAVFNLVSMIETPFLSQSGPKLQKVFIGTRSRMSSIMSEIHIIIWLFVLELLKIAVLNLVRDLISQSVWTKVAQSIYKHKISDQFDNEQNLSSNMEVVCLPANKY